ncbi:helix-turn-helix domain-containing protein [Microlunatus elymi]|uniref:Helix-turn-helix domain-containing protein n=1 Tax=Microlunatus elymi TaxID=2596828 RepID=A0A516PUZ9_9ACTN|nr:helix-turn-helix transcriptional regulator [Microlunatus elymi]QDP94973.1 helix-turn-helix domain-containing protein [Microlunatus elymi]
MTRIVDPSFGVQLRELRAARGLSLRELGLAAYVSKSQISEYETGRRRPSAEMAGYLDQALEADGALSALVVESHTDDDATNRIAHALAAPTSVDAETVESLGRMLEQQRHLDDTLPAPMLLPTVEGHLEMVQALARNARGPHASALRLVATEWCQFAGWMNGQVRHDTRGSKLLTDAARDALDLGAPDLASQSYNFRGYIERRKGNARGIVRWFMTAYETPGASDLHRVDAAVQAVHGFGLLGDHKGAQNLLAMADDLSTSVGERSGNVSTRYYWLTPAWLRLPIGLAHLGLGNYSLAADSLRAGLDQLPESWRKAEWSAEYRNALTRAETAVA